MIKGVFDLMAQKKVEMRAMNGIDMCIYSMVCVVMVSFCI